MTLTGKMQMTRNVPTIENTEVKIAASTIRFPEMRDFLAHIINCNCAITFLMGLFGLLNSATNATSWLMILFFFFIPFI